MGLQDPFQLRMCLNVAAITGFCNCSMILNDDEDLPHIQVWFDPNL
jgi:hypothetical protein